MINSSTSPKKEDSTLTVIVIIMLAIGVLAVAAIYILPAYRKSTNPETVEVQVTPTIGADTPNNGN